MPILGLTDRTPSFKEIGRLRLGISKAEMQQGGPREIGHFRADFRPDAADAAVEFALVYGPHPQAINIRLPFPEIIRSWDAYYMVYNKTGLLGMADGQKWLYLRHNQTGALIVKDGIPENAAGLPVDASGLPYMPFDKTVPVYSYKSKSGQDVPIYARPEGRLKVLIPELKRAAFVTVITHSVYNVIKLSEQLAGVEQVARNAGMSLPMVPMVLSRRQETISVSFNGTKQMQLRYLLNIEIDPKWMEAQFRFLDGMLPGGTAQLAAPAVYSLPAGYEPGPEDLSEEEPEGQDQPPEPEEPPPAAEAAPAPINNGVARPYPPETLREKLLARAVTHAMKAVWVSQIQLAAHLLGLPFVGEHEADKMRHTVQEYLFGKPSLKDAPAGAVIAMLNDWLMPKADSGGAYSIDATAEKEIRAVYAEALRLQGQIEMPL